MLFLSHAYLGWTPWFGFFLRFAPSPWWCAWLFLAGVTTCAILVLPCCACGPHLVPLGVDRRCERRSSIEWDGARAVVFRGIGVGQTTCVCVRERERQGGCVGGTIRWVSILSVVSFSLPPLSIGFDSRFERNGQTRMPSFRKGGVTSIERRSNHARRRHNSSGRCVDATMAERDVDVERRGRGGARRKENEKETKTRTQPKRTKTWRSDP